jgi:large subunit ribosomal protein L19e
MNLRSQRRMAAEILNCGKERVWIDDSYPNIESAITRRDIRGLIKKGVIKRKKLVDTSRGRARALHVKKTRGQRKKTGSIKGAKYAKVPRKRQWITKIRALRKLLFGLRRNGKLKPEDFRDLYKKAGGGFFRDRSHLRLYMEKKGMI